MQYRRAYVPGGSYFFTVVTAHRHPLFVDETNVNVLRSAFRKTRRQRPFQIDAIVVLPDHLHCIWQLPENDSDFSTRWRLIKTWFTKHSNSGLRNFSGREGNERDSRIWQKRYWEHLIRDEEDYRRHIEYIHYNPVKHGYVSRPLDWPYSSFRLYVESEMYPSDWGASVVEFPDWVGHE